MVVFEWIVNACILGLVSIFVGGFLKRLRLTPESERVYKLLTEEPFAWQDDSIADGVWLFHEATTTRIHSYSGSAKDIEILRGLEATISPGVLWSSADQKKIMRGIGEMRARCAANLLPPQFGWRAWKLTHTGRLSSPWMGTVWVDPELRANKWDEKNMVEGAPGIHALRAPMEWEKMTPSCQMTGGTPYCATQTVVGLVERYGKYVLGTKGWRAEWVVIRKLLAPNEEVAEKLRLHYPDVEIAVKGKDNGNRQGD